MTVPMIGWTPRPRNGLRLQRRQVRRAAVHRPSGPGLRQRREARRHRLITGNDPADTSTPAGADFVTGWVEYLDGEYGDAAHGGVRFYNLDNEPDIWHSTHRDVHPAGRCATTRCATAPTPSPPPIKAADPAAQTLGPVGWGWNSLFMSGLDQETCGSRAAVAGPTRRTRPRTAGCDFGAWYLQQMAAYEQAHGTPHPRLLRQPLVPAGSRRLRGADDAATQALRLRSTRAAVGPHLQSTRAGSTSRSWLIPRMSTWSTQNYPGTKRRSPSTTGARSTTSTADSPQADVLGIFGREGLDLATLWSPPAATDPGAFAFRMYLQLRRQRRPASATPPSAPPAPTRDNCRCTRRSAAATRL